MTFIILFTDAHDADPNIRKTHMADHLAFLEANADKVRAAGPLVDPESRGRDGLWIVETENPREVEDLIRQDPFWPTGLRAGYSVLPWTQVFADGRRTL